MILSSLVAVGRNRTDRQMKETWLGCETVAELREAYGVRGACSRFRMVWTFESGSKLHALHTLRAVRQPSRSPATFLSSADPSDCGQRQLKKTESWQDRIIFSGRFNMILSCHD